MDDQRLMDDRLRAVCQLMVPTVRETAGLHHYDGQIQDLSPAGVRAGLAALEKARQQARDHAQRHPDPDRTDPQGDAPGGDVGAPGGRIQPSSPTAFGDQASPDGAPAAREFTGSHDEAHLTVFEEAMLVRFGQLQMHRRDPYLHLSNLELATYDRAYASAEQRHEARLRHLAHWPAAVDAAIASLDLVSAPVAAAQLGVVGGLANGPSEATRPPGATEGGPDDPGNGRLDPSVRALVADANAAHKRLMAHLAKAAKDGDPDAALGGAGLAELMGSQEGLTVDLAGLTERAEAERARLSELLTESCLAFDARRTVAELLPELLADHPGADGVVAEAARLTVEMIAFSRSRRLVPHLDGDCRVDLAPPSRRWSMAMMSWAAPEEPDAPSSYYITPPEPHWPDIEQQEWLAVFSRTSLPAITAHEVAPGHFAHGRSLRRAATPIRRILQSEAFVEGWAHYGEELCLEEGFRAEPGRADHRDGARFAIGVALEALIRVTRLTCAIGFHTGAMDVAEATRRFMTDAHLPRAAAASEARRGTFDATYGRYTWGKLEIQALRDRARTRWGAGYTLERFHGALLELGSPPLGLLNVVLEQGS